MPVVRSLYCLIFVERRVIVVCAALCGATILVRASALPVGNTVVGASTTHVVAKGESLVGVGARFGIDVSPLAAENGLSPRALLRVGQQLRIDSPHIVPPALDDGLIVNVPQRMLFLVEAGKAIVAFPVAAGRPDWPTPTGAFTVITKVRDPTWNVPLTIQEEMRRKGQRVLTVVPPSPSNPLGSRWIALSVGGIGIHGTNAPNSIFQLQTHGCVRLHPDDAEDLFDRIDVGTAGRLIYEPILLARLPDGRIFLEVHRDHYHKLQDRPANIVRALAAGDDLMAAIDWEKAVRATRLAEGLARDVTAHDGFLP